MKETGIIMSGDHPLKILDGTKTMTRRTYGLEKINKNPDEWVFVEYTYTQSGYRYIFNNHRTQDTASIKCPYGGIGDLLWVRKPHQFELDGEGEYLRTLYKADGGDYSDWGTESNPFKWRPSIHMFRKDSRIERIITGLRPERLQDITEADALAEGIEPFKYDLVHLDKLPVQKYQALWDSINGKKYPWAGNWWVWVVSF